MLIDALSYAIFDWSYPSRREEILIYGYNIEKIVKIPNQNH